MAEVLGTSVRFPRRLVAERRITFVKVGRHVRIPASSVDAYITEHTVEPITVRASRLQAA
ncbi:excisionase family DNA-binding protein [Streptomyces sp. NPDC005122]